MSILKKVMIAFSILTAIKPALRKGLRVFYFAI